MGPKKKLEEVVADDVLYEQTSDDFKAMVENGQFDELLYPEDVEEQYQIDINGG